MKNWPSDARAGRWREEGPTGGRRDGGLGLRAGGAGQPPSGRTSLEAEPVLMSTIQLTSCGRRRLTSDWLSQAADAVPPAPPSPRRSASAHSGPHEPGATHTGLPATHTGPLSSPHRPSQQPTLSLGTHTSLGRRRDRSPQLPQSSGLSEFNPGCPPHPSDGTVSAGALSSFFLSTGKFMHSLKPESWSI